MSASTEPAAAAPQANSARAGMIAALAASALLIAACALAWLVSARMTGGAAPSDALFLADGARRIAAGQIPHVDFSVPIGALTLGLYRLAEIGLAPIPPFIGMHLLAFVLLVPLLLAAGRRLPPLGALLLVGLVGMAALLPFNTIGPGGATTDFYASYNRFGAAFSLAYLAFLFRADPASRGMGVLLAYAALFALGLKVVYLGVVAAPLAVLFLFDPRWRRPGIVGALLTLAVLGGIEVTTGMVSAYVADLRAMSAINGGRMGYLAVSFMLKNLAACLAVGGFVGVLVLAALADRQKAGWAAALRTPLAMAAALAMLILAESQSTGGHALAGALGLLFAPTLLATSPHSRFVAARMLLAGGVALAIGGVFAGTVLYKGLGNLLRQEGAPVSPDWATRLLPDIGVPERRAATAEARARLYAEAAPVMGAIAASGTSVLDPNDYFVQLAQWKAAGDALAALGAGGVNLGKVTTLAFVDLFGLALQAPAPRGLKIVLDPGRTVMPMTEAEALRYLADVDAVFVPTCGLYQRPGDPVDLMASFAPVLAGHFTAEVLTPCWTLYRRRAFAGN
ncbi:hypothetical protein [Ancylobacter terrae]|uniref:hypothetical protein n=1 Tax=Ancylobacter sp. sgz301288 TaxID=3342077 RepID=UPI00385BAFDF